jgi:cell division protein ZipA
MSKFTNEPKFDFGTAPTDLNEEDVRESSACSESVYVTPDHYLIEDTLVDGEKIKLDCDLESESAPFIISPPRAILPSSDVSQIVTQVGDITSNNLTTEKPTLAVGAKISKITVALTVMAPRKRLFIGADIQAAAEEAGLQLSTTGLFERYLTTELYSIRGTSVFSLAHLRKPGSFDLKTLASLSTPGLLLFSNLPGSFNSIEVLDLLMLTAYQLARRLSGSICDENCHRLTNKYLLDLKDQVARMTLHRTDP